MAELVDHHRNDEPEPDGKSERNKIIDPRDGKDIFQFIGSGQGRMLDNDMLDRQEQHEGHECRYDDHHGNPQGPIDAEE